MRHRPLPAVFPLFLAASFGLPTAAAQTAGSASNPPSSVPIVRLDEPDYTAIGFMESQIKTLKEAFAAERAGRMEEALELFSKQYYEHPTFPAEAEFGLALLRAGHWVLAARRLSHATLDNVFRFHARSAQYLRDKLQEARSHVGTFNVRVNVPGAVVNIDGVEMRDWPYLDMVFVPPGKHNVKVTLEGYYSSHIDVEVQEGQTKEVTLALQLRERQEIRNIYRPMDINVTNQMGEKEPGWVKPVLTVSAIGIAFSGGALVLGLVQGSAAEKDKLAQFDIVGRSGCSYPELVDNCAAMAEAQARQDRWYAVAIAGGIGTAISVAGFALGLVNRPTQPAQIHVQPVIGRGGGGLHVDGSF